MHIKSLVLPVVVAAGVAAIAGIASRDPLDVRLPAGRRQDLGDVSAAARAVDAALQARWDQAGLVPADPADELTVLRRLALALYGSLPSLEEVRRFEADTQPDRLNRWTADMLEDRRFADYFAERLARAFVGVEGGQFIIFRRDRFTGWLSEQLQKHRPYDVLVRDMIAGQGVWTGEPQTNFITAGYANDDFDENKLAGRTVRAFLGQRIDCAQCHDHPFTHWKQHDFEGLAAQYGQLKVSLVGIEDKPELEYKVQDRMTLEDRHVAPAVPFHPEWLPASGTRREKLAAWVTHPQNRRFERAIANRVWGLMFGKPFASQLQVDDLPDPDDPDTADELKVLDILGADFRAHDCDLGRLVQVIAATRAFRLDSQHSSADPQELQKLETAWGLFPLVRLRPEQVIGSMLQASSVKTIDQNSHLFIRFLRFTRERDFVNEFGDPGESELGDRTGTIPQALLRMNGQLPTELEQESPFTAVGRIGAMAGTPDKCLDDLFLVCLTRRPTNGERAHLLPQLEARVAKKDKTDGTIQDIAWALFNSEEFSWNH